MASIVESEARVIRRVKPGRPQELRAGRSSDRVTDI
jgi:hypothetical protein